jgi:hypothetical protein
MAVKCDGGANADFICSVYSSLSMPLLPSDGYKYLKYKSPAVNM